MGLRQRIADLIGRWDGSDAAERAEQLVSELVSLLDGEQRADTGALASMSSATAASAQRPAA